MRFTKLFEFIKNKKLEIEKEANPFPHLIPEEVWAARQAWANCQDTERKAALLAAYDKAVASYQQDHKRDFLKDEQGSFLKVNGLKEQGA